MLRFRFQINWPLNTILHKRLGKIRECEHTNIHVKIKLRARVIGQIKLGFYPNISKTYVDVNDL